MDFELPAKLQFLRTLITPRGMETFTGAIADYKTKHGAKWLSEFQAKMPQFSEIIDLCANYEFEEAWPRFVQLADDWIDEEESMLKRMAMHAIKGSVLEGARPDMEKLHRRARAEIDRPRI